MNFSEKFRQECAIVSSLKQKRIDLMNDRTSAIGRALLTRAKNEKTFENHKKEVGHSFMYDRKFNPIFKTTHVLLFFSKLISLIIYEFT